MPRTLGEVAAEIILAALDNVLRGNISFNGQ
jgi:hypothetical protein